MFFRRAQRVSLAVAALCTAPLAALIAQDTLRIAPVAVHGFIQTYYRSGDPFVKDGYRLRKADPKFSGDISQKLKWRVTFDAAKVLTVNKTTTVVGDALALSDASID